MDKSEFKYFVFDGASCQYFKDSLFAVMCFVDTVRRYPKFADLVELHRIVDSEAGTSVIVGCTKEGFRLD